VLKARGVRIFGVSVDDVADSRGFARDYGIPFPLLSDRGGAVSRAYVGLDDNDVSVPGIVVIRKDGEIVFRQVAAAADDRLTAADVIAAVDKSLGTTGKPARTGYAAIDRTQLRLEGAAATVRGDDDTWRPTGFTTLSVMYPPVRHVVIAAGFRYEARDSILQGETSVGFRIPILAEVGAIQVLATVAPPGLHTDGWYAGGRAGVWVALKPTWAVHLDAGAGSYGLGGDGSARPEVFVTAGIARLFSFTSR
jgi:hypothetical protein